MKHFKTLHLASFDGNIGDNANHYGFYKYLNRLDNFTFEIDKLEIREFYWKNKFFDRSFVELVNSYDLLIIGGGNYFELWVEDSPTGTSIAIELNLLRSIKTPILFNALGVDPGQGVSQNNINKFKKFLDVLTERNDLISIRNDGAKKAIEEFIGKEYLSKIVQTVDAGFFVDCNPIKSYYANKKYIAINVAYDMLDVRFHELTYDSFLLLFKSFIEMFLNQNKDFEFIFIPHIYRDLGFINDILNILDDKTRRKYISVAPLLHGENSFKEIISIYNGAKLILANRFHANVCSIGLGKKTIGLVNYRQIDELYKELESNNFVNINENNFDKILLSKIENIENISLLGLTESYNNYMKSISKWLANV